MPWPASADPIMRAIYRSLIEEQLREGQKLIDYLSPPEERERRRRDRFADGIPMAWKS